MHYQSVAKLQRVGSWGFQPPVFFMATYHVTVALQELKGLFLGGQNALKYTDFNNKS